MPNILGSIIPWRWSCICISTPFVTLMTWAIANGYKRYVSTGLNYDPKWHLRFQLYPLDLYVRHTSRNSQHGVEMDVAAARADALRQDAAAIRQSPRALAQRPGREIRGGAIPFIPMQDFEGIGSGARKSEERMRKLHLSSSCLPVSCGSPALAAEPMGEWLVAEWRRAHPYRALRQCALGCHLLGARAGSRQPESGSRRSASRSIVGVPILRAMKPASQRTDGRAKSTTRKTAKCIPPISRWSAMMC